MQVALTSSELQASAAAAPHHPLTSGTHHHHHALRHSAHSDRAAITARSSLPRHLSLHSTGRPQGARFAGRLKGTTMAWSRGISRIQVMLAELLGTFFIVLSYSLSDGHALATALAVIVQVYSLSHVSMGQFNPAVTIGLLATQAIGVWQAICTILMQVLGAMMAGSAAASISDTLVVPQPTTMSFAGNLKAGAAELLFTIALVLVVLNSLRKQPNSYFGLAAGFVVVAGMSCIRSISGGALNPALAWGLQYAAVTISNTGSLSTTILYWLTGIVGGLVAAGIYLFMNRASDLAASKSPTDDDGGVIPDEPKAGIAAVLLVECIGTFFWALTASMGDPLSVGCIITSMVYMGDHVSGGQYNPAVSLGTAIRFRAPLPDYLHVVLKSIAQLGGAIVAGFVSYALTDRVAYPHPDGANGAFGAFVFEVIYTTYLVFIVLCVATPTSEIDAQDGTDEDTPQSYYGMAIGFTVGAGSFCAGITGGGSGGVFNPAVGTGLGIADVVMLKVPGNGIWVAWAAPLLGAIVGPILFTLLHSRQERFGYRPL